MTFGLVWFLTVGAASAQEVPSPRTRPEPDAREVHEMPDDKLFVEPLEGLKPFVSVTVRYDNIWTTDPTDLFWVPAEQFGPADDIEFGEYLDGFRTKVRFGLKYEKPSNLVDGGVRVAVGQNPNPSSSFVPLGDVFRPTGIGLDQYWLKIKPLKGKMAQVDLSLTAGKMPNPLWRGKVDGSAFASEMIWDNDVNPAGVAGHAKIGTGDVSLSNVTAYWVIQDIEDRRFAGLTGEITKVVSQVRVDHPWATGAIGFYAIDNINSGLRAPGVTGSGNALIDPGSNAFLMNPGLQATNSRVNYGPGAIGFIEDRMFLLSGGAQLHPEFEIDSMPIKPHLMVDAVLNTVYFQRNRGIGITAGTVIGGFGDDVAIHPIDFWFTYRNVEADATLSAIGDSDLGRGTEYEGIEVALAYSLSKQLKVSSAFFDFVRFPARQVHDRRLFVDIIANF